MECKCGGSTTSYTYEVRSIKDQEKYSNPVPEIGSVVQLRTCSACRRVDRDVLYVNPKLKQAPEPVPATTNNLFDFF